MVETISVLGFILALLFGSAQIVLMGFYQLQLDAATFLFSHNYALSPTGTVNTTSIAQAVPIAVPNATMKTVASPPPNTSVADPNGLAVLGEYITGGVSNGTSDPHGERFGGASIIVPQQIQTTGTLNLTSFDTSLFTSNPIVLSSGNIEGQMMVDAHDDDSEGYSYNSSSDAGDLVNPYLAYGGATNGDDQDVPPYYFTMAYMSDCNYTPLTGYDCVPPDASLNALGLAEYLKDDSNVDAANGNYTLSGEGTNVGYMFGAMTQHEQTFAYLAQLLTTAPYNSYATAFALLKNNTPNVFVEYTHCMSVDWDIAHDQFPATTDYGRVEPQTPLTQVNASC